MVKYTYTECDESTKHWEYCQQEKVPYIALSRISKNYINIFYDVTFLKNINISEISDFITNLSKYYYEFFGTNYSEITTDYGTKYLFNFSVINSHATFIAEVLFDYLNRKQKYQH